MQKRAQVTLFVVIAIVIVAGIAIFFAVKPRIAPAVPSEFRPIQTYFLGCVQEKLREGVDIASSQGGWIEVPAFEPGSSYMPFSSQLDFFGIGIPYWYYISGNNIARQQVPSLALIEQQLADFLEEKIAECDFSQFREEGFNITTGIPSAKIKIGTNSIDAEVNYEITITKDSTTTKLTTHSTTISSKLGKFYDTARKIYDAEQSGLFLENYTLDILSLYAPTTNFEINCAPKVWLKNDIENQIKEAIEANMAAIKFRGENYKLKVPEHKYFVVPVSVDENINLLYSPNWPTKLEIAHDATETNGAIIAKPLGSQAGLSMLGFCIVQWHFVYDLAFPVMVQVYDEREMFQFPVLVIIKANKAREQAAALETPGKLEPEICKYKISPALIYTYNNNFEPIEAAIRFKCLNEVCELGNTSIIGEDALLETNMPQCLGAFLLAEADGYAPAKLQINSNAPVEAELMLNKLHTLAVELDVAGIPLAADEQAIVSFTSQDYTTTIALPQQNQVELPEGYYNISVSVFRPGNIQLGEYSRTECVKVPAKGIGAFFGLESRKCYDITVPAQTVTQILGGGGNAQIYFSEDELAEASKLLISASYIAAPSNILELQDAYLELETADIAAWLE